MINSDSCPDKDKCTQVLHLVIDGEATHEDEDYFFNHILQCTDCSRFYVLEQSIRDALRSGKLRAPEEFIHQIRMKIKESDQ